MSSILISTDQINPRPNTHWPMRVALPPKGGPCQRMPAKKRVKRHKKKKVGKKKK